MEFSEKLSKLMILTDTRGKELAKHINIDSSQISRIKTGARGKPSQVSVLRMMADFFAARCRSEYRLNALAEISGKKEIRAAYTERELSDALLSWLMENDSGSYLIEKKNGAGSPLYKGHETVSGRSVLPVAQKNNVSEPPNNIAEPPYIYYMDNNGKRNAVIDLINKMLMAEKPGVTYIFTDEDSRWLFEDQDFIKTVSEAISHLTEIGWKFVRVEPQLHGIDQSFFQ